MSHKNHEQSTQNNLKSGCSTCAPQTPLRNHYFFGKLMDVPDFDVEQQYVIEKLKRHHQRLHGTGVICGLEVTAHANPACRDRYLVIEPGAALDCCGNEILVLNEEILDLHAFPEVARLIEEGDEDEADHVLQLCIRYRECPTEDVPVLYDECGCDDTRCAPNRILESYAFDVRVDPPLPAPIAPFAPTLEWNATLNLSNPKVILVHEDSQRIYVAADLGSGGIVQQFRLHNGEPIASRTFDNPRVLALAANADGSRLFVAVRSNDGFSVTLEVFNTDGMGPLVSSTPLHCGDLSIQKVSLLMLPSGKLASLVVVGQESDFKSNVQLWNINDTLRTKSDQYLATTSSGFWIDLTLGSDGTTLYAAEASHTDGKTTVHRFNTGETNLSPKTVEIVGSDIITLAVVEGDESGDLLAWIERGAETAPSNVKLAKIIKGDGGTVSTTPTWIISLPAPPVDLVIASGGRFAYVLIQPEGSSAQVISVDLHRLRTGSSPALVLGSALSIGGRGDQGVALALAQEGTLYAAYDRSVAVLAIHDTDCGEYLKRHDCPDCDMADCVTLATIQHWRPGYRLENAIVPPSDPGDDAEGEIARIDNDLGRSVIPSVADLAKTVACILERGVGGGRGERGPRGPSGNDGKNGADGINGIDGEPGSPGKDGIGLDWELPHICDINWVHGEKINPDFFSREYQESGLVVAFDTNMLNSDIHENSVRVRVGRLFKESQNSIELWCWCDLSLRGWLSGGDVEEEGNASSTFSSKTTNTITALQIRFPEDLFLSLLKGDGVKNGLRIQIIIEGDFIRGKHRGDDRLCALDGDHLPELDGLDGMPKWLQPGSRRRSGDGVEGGTFISWFDISYDFKRDESESKLKK